MHSTRFMSKPHKDYTEAIHWLFEQFPSYQVIGSKAYKPTLENIRVLLEIIGNPQDQLKFVHVAGSNGKGSTCSMIASCLTESNYKVGLFTSPHIEDYSERIRVNGQTIYHDSVTKFVNQIKDEQLSFSPSFFEITFALALQHFAEESCDICIIETGLGGRLDATNVIDPILSIITTISLEHTDILGDTVEEIAIEKAGIIKQNTPILIGGIQSPAIDEIKNVAESMNAPMYNCENAIEIHSEFSLLGLYQRDNYKLAISALNILKEQGVPVKNSAFMRGIDNLSLNTGFRGRLQIISRNPLTIMDVSHNPDGIKATLDTVAELNAGTLHIIFGLSADKDLKQIISTFPDHANTYFTEFSNLRSAKIAQIQEISDLHPKDLKFFENPKSALEGAQNIAKQDDTILIIGSFFLVADFF